LIKTMTQIHKLSVEQLAMIPQVRDDWLKIGLDTTPVNQADVREILDRLYAVAGKTAPKNIMFFGGPLEISLAIAKLRFEDATIRLQVSDLVNGEFRRQIIGQINKQVAGLISSQSRFEFNVAALTPDLEVIEHVRARVGEIFHAQFGGLRAWPFSGDFGQFDVSLAWYDFAGRLGIDVSQLIPSFDLAKSCGWAVLFWDWAFISSKPEFIHRDERGLLHCETGPAVHYPDGFSVFAIHGVRVPEKVVIAPESIVISEIESERNAEVRRVMIDRYGSERYLMESGAEEVHRDDFGILYRKEILGDESLVMVKVVNSTPEPDGSFKDYFLRVPPTMERARQAVAWTFGKKENEYSPALQT